MHTTVVVGRSTRRAFIVIRDRVAAARLLIIVVVMAWRLRTCNADEDDDYQNFGSLLRYSAASTTTNNNNGRCPRGCACDELTNSLKCENVEMAGWPPLQNDASTKAANGYESVDGWPLTRFETIHIQNCSGLAALSTSAFRHFLNLREIYVRKMPHLHAIEKHAFKGLPKLRLIEVSHNELLTELHRGAFSAIGNEHSLRVRVSNNALRRVRAFAFKSATNLRELTVEDACFAVDAAAFSGLHMVDFFTIRGACSIAGGAFANTSRVHNLDVVDSTLDLRHNTFAQLHHVSQIQLRENRIGRIEAEAFAGLFTVGAAHLQSNRIGRVEARAFANAENLGSLVLSYNTIHEPLLSPDCLVNGAQKFVFTENTLNCTCEMRWIQFHENTALLAENYCGRESSFKALAYYKPLGCPPLRVINTVSESIEANEEAITAAAQRTSNQARQIVVRQKNAEDISANKVAASVAPDADAKNRHRSGYDNDEEQKPAESHDGGDARTTTTTRTSDSSLAKIGSRIFAKFQNSANTNSNFTFLFSKSLLFASFASLLLYRI